MQIEDENFYTNFTNSTNFERQNLAELVQIREITVQSFCFHLRPSASI